ncbi:hypothetical protein FRB95_004348 [Tulasnella sp. JGI-2019a]|nr:hypothetical protein FRB95_004348 [Tulasnella sp. JGI-2019a]
MSALNTSAKGNVHPPPFQPMFERATGPPAEALLSQCGILDSSTTNTPLRVYDGACGTGIVGSLLYKSAALEGRSLNVMCGDISPLMVEAVNKRIADEGWKGAEGKVIDAQDTKLSPGFTHSFVNFAIQFLPDPLAGLRECHRVLVPGGAIAFSCWKHVGWHDWMKLAISRVPGAPPLPPITEIFPKNGNWEEPSWVQQQLEDLGFENCRVELLDFAAPMDNAKMFVEGFKVMIPMVISRWDEKDRVQYAPLIAPELEKFLEEQYGKDTAFSMRMVAVLSTAIKPSKE